MNSFIFIVMKRSIIFTLAIILICPIMEARQPKRGYRGFLEWSSSVRSEGFIDVLDTDDNLKTLRENCFYTGFTTSHGYQINPLFFVGAGLGMERCGKIGNWIAPVFVQGRVDLKFGKFTPFGDLRLGANLAEGAGVYFSPTIGYRFNWGHKMGVNLGAGLSLAGYKIEIYEGTWLDPDSFEIHYVATRHRVRPYFSFRLGIDF